MVVAGSVAKDLAGDAGCHGRIYRGTWRLQHVEGDGDYLRVKVRGLDEDYI